MGKKMRQDSSDELISSSLNSRAWTESCSAVFYDNEVAVRLGSCNSLVLFGQVGMIETMTVIFGIKERLVLYGASGMSGIAARYTGLSLQRLTETVCPQCGLLM